MDGTAILLANGLLATSNGKTSHGLIRGPSRYRILGVVDPTQAGRDAGEVLDGRHRGIPVFDSVGALLAAVPERPDHCVLGVATAGGKLPPALRAGMVEAAEAGMSLVNGLHQLLCDLPDVVAAAERGGGRLIDLRKPRPTRELHFWSGAIYDVAAPRVAVLGTDCALGKRTTCTLLLAACRAAGLAAEMIYTGQTGWLQGMRYGFIFDATPNDFTCGELEHAIVTCDRETRPDVILIEGQSSLRNPSGPCGAEILLSGATTGVVLQHAPGRRDFIDTERPIPPVEEEVELIRRYGVEVWALTLNTEGLAPADLEPVRTRLAERLGLPVVLPLVDGVDTVALEIRRRVTKERTP